MARRLMETVLEVEGDPTIYVHSREQARTVQAWALDECPGAVPQDSDVALPDGRVLRILLRPDAASYAGLRCTDCGRPLRVVRHETGRCADCY